MAKIRSGVLGNTRGKVAGVVGSQWKNVNYIREYVKPANPNTAAQQAQRLKMSSAVAFAKSLVGPIFNAYTDKFQKGMSGFNYFIKQNIAEFDGSLDYSALKITEGKLHAVDTIDPEYITGTGVLTVSFGATLGNNGALDDAVFVAVIDESTGLWYFSSAEWARNGVFDEVTLPTGLTATDLHVYVFAAQYSGTIVNMISDSAYANGTAP